MTKNIDAGEYILESSVESPNEVTKKVNLKIKPEKVAEQLDSQYQDLKKTANIKGFRKGKAPMAMLKRYYGEHVEVEVKSNLLGTVMKHVIDENEIKLVAEPQVEKVDILDDNTLEAILVFEVRPEVKVKDYKGLDITREPLNVLDAAVDQRLESIRQQHATMEPVDEDRPAEDGDVAEIDYEGKLDGEPFEGGAGQGRDLELGSNSFIPGFEEGVVGMKAGESKELKLTFPEDYQAAHLAGKETVFTVTLKAIKAKSLPELDDDFAKDLGGDFKSIQEVKDRIKKDIEMGETNRIRRADRNNVIDALFENNHVEAPNSLVKNQLEAMMQQAAFSLQMSGLTKEQAEQMLQGSGEKYKDEAEREVKAAFLFEAIAKAEGIEITSEDVEKRFEKIAADTDRNVDQVKAVYEKDNAKARLEEEILEDMVLDFLLENANVKWEEPVGKGSASKGSEDHDKGQAEDKSE